MSTEFTFRDFLILEDEVLSERRMITVDADDPNQAKAEISQGARQDPKVVARKEAIEANKERNTVSQDKESTGPDAALAKQEAKEAAMLARTRDRRAKTQAVAK